MSITANRARQLAITKRTFGLRGNVCTLGAQTLQVADSEIDAIARSCGVEPVQAQGFFQRIGFDTVESVDISDFEGCTQIHDLNRPIPDNLRERFDYAFNGGTIEHVFDVPTALANVFAMLKVGGCVTHGGPVNGWVDHGFYQFSPTLFLDYYVANRFEILEAEIVETMRNDEELWRMIPYQAGNLDGVGSFVGSVRWNIYFTARKTAESRCDVIPLQSYYAKIYGDPKTAPALGRCEPYWLRGGFPAEPPKPKLIDRILHRHS